MQKNTKYKKLQNNTNNSFSDKLILMALFVVNMTTNIVFYPYKILVSFYFHIINSSNGLILLIHVHRAC